MKNVHPRLACLLTDASRLCILMSAERLTDFAASETLVVGDMNVDILMGANAGAKTCGVTYGNGTKAELEAVGADYIIDSFEELTQVLGCKV